MKILALEFSSSERSVALVVNGRPGSILTETGGRGVNAFGMIERALSQAGVEREEIECVAVGLGPGSYTGIRAAIAVAQGWQLALGVKLLGVSSVEALALDAQKQGWFGTVNIVIDAQRNEFYLARYEITAEDRRAIAQLKLVSRDEVTKHVSADILIGPGMDKLFPGARALCPSAAAVAQWASGWTGYVPLKGEELEPIYLRETGFVKAPAPRILPAG